jgi:DNA-binding beta-propeller fold protein YncE
VGLGVDDLGNLYVADSGNHTIRKITPAGVMTTLAGSAGHGGTNDGVGGAARFASPLGVAADSAGNVYVADSRNNTIRKITPAGAVTTLAGLAQFDPTGWPIGGSTDGTGSEALAGIHESVGIRRRRQTRKKC